MDSSDDVNLRGTVSETSLKEDETSIALSETQREPKTTIDDNATDILQFSMMDWLNELEEDTKDLEVNDTDCEEWERILFPSQWEQQRSTRNGYSEDLQKKMMVEKMTMSRSDKAKIYGLSEDDMEFMDNLDKELETMESFTNVPGTQVVYRSDPEPMQRYRRSAAIPRAAVMKKPAAASKAATPVGLSAADLAFMDEVDKELAELDSEPAPKSTRATIAGAGKASPPPKRGKCFPLSIGGTEYPLGCNPYAAEPCCGNLLCVNCDFKILSFEGREWDDDCEYLFFRNFMPEVDKLQKKLHVARDSRAYCCQCKWVSVKQVTKIQTLKGFHSKWVCRTDLK